MFILHTPLKRYCLAWLMVASSFLTASLSKPIPAISVSFDFNFFAAETVMRSLIVNDTDGDGIQDSSDADADNDGIPNLLEGNGDTDNDGVPDHLDLDSDNDGIPDTVEAGYQDPDSNGLPATGNYFTSVTPNGTPLLNNQALALNLLPDFDSDNRPDNKDLDTDNDGLNDVIESGGNLPDLNNDGMVDGPDTDADGLMNPCDPVPGGSNAPGVLTSDPVRLSALFSPNYKDLDADNDGISDWNESGLPASSDTNSDGLADGSDPDADGIPASVDGSPTFGDALLNGQPAQPQNKDGDTLPDYRDLDTDNDGIPDLYESAVTGFTDINKDGMMDLPDADKDGINDSGDANDNVFGDADVTDTPVDTDGDGLANYKDLDADNDGIHDLIECRLYINSDADSDGTADGPDSDNDGINDAVDSDDFNPGTPGFNFSPADTDKDTIADWLDLDSDNDGINDVNEALPGLDTNADGRCDGNDADGDGINDSADANTSVFGDPDLTDAPKDKDADSYPDYRDLDADNDGLNDNWEAGLNAFDLNNDGQADGGDSDADGIRNSVDGTNGFGDAVSAAFGGLPRNTDEDNLPDYSDTDSDNDGLPDLVETGNASLDGNNDGMINGSDNDGDGIKNQVDGNSSVFGDALLGQLQFSDADNDGLPDVLDKDSDNDGIEDGVEQGGSDKDNDGKLDAGSAATLNYKEDCDQDNIPNYQDADRCDLFVPEIFTPNGDGINDVLVIKGIEKYTNAQLKIFNRWGGLVFESSGIYKNDWDGTNLNGARIGGDKLPVGTYFYILEPNAPKDAIGPKKGSIYIQY